MKAGREFRKVFGKIAIPRLINIMKNTKPMYYKCVDSKGKFRKIAKKAEIMQLTNWM